MSNVDQVTNAAVTVNTSTDAPPSEPVEDKGKGKNKLDDAMDEDDEDDDDDDDDEEEEGEEEDVEAEESFAEIDASAILPPGRRTRGVKIDYTSTEALRKAGLENGESVEGDEEEEFVTQDNSIETD